MHGEVSLIAHPAAGVRQARWLPTAHPLHISGSRGTHSYTADGAAGARIKARLVEGGGAAQAWVGVRDGALDPQPVVVLARAVLKDVERSCRSKEGGLLAGEPRSGACRRGAALVIDIGEICGGDGDPGTGYHS